MSSIVVLLLVGLLIALNGLFVAAEFSLVAVRRGLIEERAAAGDGAAKTVLQVISNLSFMLSSAQFGITATSLVVGFLAEDALGEVVIRPMLEALGLPEGSSTAIAVTIALLASTVLQMLFGELAPKNYAIARPEPTALLVARPMRLFGVVFGPVIRVFDRSAEFVSERVFGIEVLDELVAGHSLDELSRIISASGEEGALSVEQAELLMRAVELGDTRLSSVMVPRPDVVWLQREQPLTALRDASRATGHSRFPIFAESEDDVVGTIHIKDLLQVEPERRSEVTVGQVASPPLLVPESETIRRLFGKFRRGHRTFSVVVDEYGGTAGIVTIEDLIEELVGEIRDEFDRTGTGAVRRLGPTRFAVEGTLRIDELQSEIDLIVPEGDYETLAGFVLDRLGRIPDEGDTLDFEGWRLIVARMDGVRIAEVRLRAPRMRP